MVGADDSNGEISFGFTVDGLYQIILRPGKLIFFRKKKILLNFLFYVNFLIGLMYRD